MNFFNCLLHEVKEPMLNRAELQRRRAKLNKSFRQVAIERGSSEMDIRKQFVFALFWKRLYLGGDPGWLLLGGPG